MLEVEQCLDVCKGPDGVVGVTCVGRRVVEVSRPECGMRVGDRLVWLNGMKVVDDSGIVSELLCAMPRQFEAVVLRSMFAEGEAPLQQPGTEAPAANHPAFHTSTYAETCRRLADQGQRRQLYPSEVLARPHHTPPPAATASYSSAWPHLARPAGTSMATTTATSHRSQPSPHFSDPLVQRTRLHSESRSTSPRRPGLLHA
eukprot:Rhum_TRINITY_DN4793_c0_g1::Rhum_TRINITY_DN4793_c0_g1_i1::g.15712::m.15712